MKLNGTDLLDREIRVERYSAKKLAQKQMKKENMSKQRKLGNAKKNADKDDRKAAGGGGGGIDKKMGKKKNKVKPVKEFMGTKGVDNKKVII